MIIKAQTPHVILTRLATIDLTRMQTWHMQLKRLPLTLNGDCDSFRPSVKIGKKIKANPLTLIREKIKANPLQVFFEKNLRGWAFTF